MKYDVAVIGAGFGGLGCASKLAKSGHKVLLLEKIPHVGGTSYVFQRGKYAFPMGPLGFSNPQYVSEFLEEVGVRDKPSFTRSHFQLISPEMDITYSLPLEEFQTELKDRFPNESGLDNFFQELGEVISLVKDISYWHPDYLIGGRKLSALNGIDGKVRRKMAIIDAYSSTPCSHLLDRSIKDPALKNLLGSMGVRPPHMSLLNLAVMWNLMSEIGIFFPSCGIHGLVDRLAKTFTAQGGDLCLGQPVEEILVENGKTRGVRTTEGEVHEADWVVSNADFKRTFLEMIDPSSIPSDFLNAVQRVPYTGSEVCVYLGADASKVDWTALKARHLFYCRKNGSSKSGVADDFDFDDREIEICVWSDPPAELAPPGKKALVLRTGFTYDSFASFRTGEKQRKPEYRLHKEKLANSIIREAENILPGLSSSIEVREAATPLTYEDWGQRYRGSIAGWSWAAKNQGRLGGNLLIETPIRNLLMVGIYAATELWRGGVPTALHTGSLAADLIDQRAGSQGA